MINSDRWLILSGRAWLLSSSATHPGMYKKGYMYA